MLYKIIISHSVATHSSYQHDNTEKVKLFTLFLITLDGCEETAQQM
jgi:hypothetical protein